MSVLDDLAARMDARANTLAGMARQRPRDDPERYRLIGKSEGVRLARSFVQDAIRRSQPAEWIDVGAPTGNAAALAEKAQGLALDDAAAIMARGFPEAEASVDDVATTERVRFDDVAGTMRADGATADDLAAVGVCPGCLFPLHDPDTDCSWRQGQPAQGGIITEDQAYKIGEG